MSTEVDPNRQTDRLQNEMKVYEALQCPKNFLSKMDTLRFWNCRRNNIPLLSKLACAIFSVPASAADVERTWSSAGLTVNKRRSRISSDNLKAIMLINRNRDLLSNFVRKLEIDTTVSDSDNLSSEI